MNEGESNKDSIIERVVNMRIEQGFIDEDFRPIMCRLCKSKNTKDFNIYVESGMVIEYGVMCDDCGAHLGHCYCGKWNTEYLF